jgi:NAD(P)-dependent dehydrogenase (short-subunit alcohol dehydrogenase family)
VRREPKQGTHYDTDVTTPTDELVTEHGVEAVYAETDTSEEADVEAAVGTAVESFGGLDAVVNNAGIQIPGGTREVDVADWAHTLDVDLTGYFLVVKHAIEHLVDSDRGRVVNVASVSAHFGGGGPGYSAAKGGVRNLSRDMALEFAPDGVTVNVVSPGVIKTPMQDINDEETMRHQAERTPLPRLGEPADVAAAVSFFASEDAEWITGAELVVDGGMIAGL